MRALAEWWTRLPAWVRWPVGILTAVVLYGIAYAVTASVLGLDSEDDDLTIRLALVVVAIPLSVAGVLRQRRRLGGKGQMRLYRQAYRSGTVPPGADVDRWRPLVRKQARFFREGRRVQRIVAVVMMGLLVLLAVVGLVLSIGDIDVAVAVTVVISLVVFAVLFWGTDRLWQMRRRQFDRLEQALHDTSG